MESEIALDILRDERVFDSTGYDGLRRRFQPQPDSQREVILPQADRGRDAWLFLAG